MELMIEREHGGEGSRKAVIEVPTAGPQGQFFVVGEGRIDPFGIANAAIRAGFFVDERGMRQNHHTRIEFSIIRSERGLIFRRKSEPGEGWLSLDVAGGQRDGEYIVRSLMVWSDDQDFNKKLKNRIKLVAESGDKY